MKKNLGTWHVVVDCFGTLNLKFYFDLLLFHLAQDLTKPQKILKKPKKHQNQPKNALFNIFKGFTWNKICSLFYSKAKNEEKLPKFFLYFFRSKTGFAIFEKKITKNFKFWILFFFNCSLMLKKVSPNFQKIVLIFKVPVIFWKWKLCHVCAARALSTIHQFIKI